ncbi:MAG: hypothetical protein NT093_00390 [Candidatus Moranbacteria bacterium]|nr:hypothetical protein [Candidatus Moranbacteria bacterium]
MSKIEKIEKLKSVMAEHSSLVRSRQEHIIFPEFIIDKTKELQDILFREFGISGKRNVLSLAVLYLLEDLENKKELEKN